MTAYIKSNGEDFNFDTDAVDKEFTFNTGASEVAVIDKRGVTDTTGRSIRTVDNLLVNGNFDIWQRADDHNSNGIGSADRWNMQSAVVSTMLTRSYFLLGQTQVPGDPQNFGWLYTGSGGASNSYSYLSQKIEGARRFSGKTLKGSFWAKTDITGQKCSLSWNVYTNAAYAGDSVLEFTLTDTWAKYEYSIDIYSLSGKGDVPNDSRDDYLELKFWFDVGSSFASEGGGIGNQTGSLSLSKVEAYTVDPLTPDVEYEVNRRTRAEELLSCQRYFYVIWKSYGILGSGYCISTVEARTLLQLPMSMRDLPVVTFDNAAALRLITNGSTISPSSHSITWEGAEDRIRFTVVISGGTVYQSATLDSFTNNRSSFDAEFTN